MGVYTFPIVDHTSPVAPARLFKAMCLDGHNFISNVPNQSIKSIDFIEGDSFSVGCVLQINFVEGFPLKYVKRTVDELDVGKCYAKYTSFESDGFGEKFDCVVYETKVEPTGTGCHFTSIGNYHVKGDIVLTRDDVKFNLEDMKNTYNQVEEYLRNNPQFYA